MKEIKQPSTKTLKKLNKSLLNITNKFPKLHHVTILGTPNNKLECNKNRLYEHVNKSCIRLFQAALCADYSVPVDCVAAGPAPRPSSFHEISAPKVSF